MDDAAVKGVHQAHGVLLQDHHQVLALQSISSSLSLAGGPDVPSTQPTCQHILVPPAYSGLSVVTAHAGIVPSGQPCQTHLDYTWDHGSG